MIDVKDLCIDFGLPLVIVILCFTLLMTGKDSEVKTLFGASIGWILNSGYRHIKKN
jgi:hypothetical protein